ncbi:MAG: hypothetical protein K2X93_00555 [Candidatus Obscuribacterales bacterium]|nr:hypothetical protein [Candidatus Obscuribacterales bacterium]
MFRRIGLVGLAVVGFIVFIGGAVLINAEVQDYLREKAVKADIDAQIAQYNQADPILGAVIDDVAFGTKTDDWVLKQTVKDPTTGSKKIAKTVFNRNKMPHLHPSGNFRLYEFFRPDGTKERDELYFPEPQLASSVISEKSVHFFDEQGKETERRQIRADGTVGSISKGNVLTHLRADGVTLRSVQDYVDKTCRLTYFRLDGKTPWWVCLYENDRQITVHFDLDGNPYEKKFVRKHLLDGYSAGPDTKPFAYFQDTYKRADGTDDYVQTWFVVWDKAIGGTREVLERVEILDEKGRVKKLVLLDISNTLRSVQSSAEFNDDGSVLIRQYGSPNCRETELLYWPEDASKVKLTNFPAGTDQFVEPLDPRILHGFHVNMYGIDDTDKFDK